MEITKEQNKRARDIASGMGVSIVFINDKGEYFTEKSLAVLSVGREMERLVEIDFGAPAQTGNDEDDDETPGSSAKPVSEAGETKAAPVKKAPAKK